MTINRVKWLLLLTLSGLLIKPAPGWAENLKMTLDEATSYALRENPSIQLYQDKLAAAQARVGQAYSIILPTLKLESSYSRIYNTPTTVTIPPLAPGMPPTEVTIGPTDPFNIWLTKASVSQLIFSPAMFPSWAIAGLGVAIAQEDLRLARQRLAYQVAGSFFALEKAGKFVAVANEGQTLAQDYLTQVQAIFKAGINTRSDVLAAQVRLANAQQVLIKAQNGQAVAQTILDQVLDLAEGTSIQPVTSDVDLSQSESFCSLDPTKFSSEFQRLQTLAYQQRPDWKQALWGVEINRQNITLAGAGYWPSLFASGSYDYQKTFSAGQPDLAAKNWAVIGGASWTLFDGLSTPNKVAEARANAGAFTQQKKLLSQQVEIEIKSNLLELGSAASLISGAKQEVDLAKENYRMALLKYKNDVGTSLEVLTAQTSLTQAETNLAQAQFDYKLAKAKLQLAVGVLGE